MTNGSKRQRTRRALIDLLKRQGPTDATELADALGVTAMAVRQHLYDMQGERLVDAQEQPRPVGRPAKLWQLTAAADAFFPDGHADLTIGLITAMKQVFGEDGLERLLAARADEQVATYRRQTDPAAELPVRLAALAAMRTEEGYMAEVQEDPDSVGTAWLLIENHCPVCSAATACTSLCRYELDVFRAVLGPSVVIDRADHILAGARRCAYRVRPLDASRD